MHELLRRTWDRIAYLATQALDGFQRARGPQLAAAVSYRFIFSIFPIAIFLVSILGIFLQNPQTRERIVDSIVDLFSLSSEGAVRLDRALEQVPPTWSVVGLVSLAVTLWTASGLMGAIRIGLNAMWRVDVDQDRPFVRSKLIDFVLVFGVGALILLSVLVTTITEIVDRVADDAEGKLGALGWIAQLGSSVFGFLVPVALAFATFLLLFRFVPAARARWRDVWVAALVTAVAFEILSVGFAFFVRTFGNYDVVYGSLGTIVAFLYFVYLGATVFLLGAGVAHAWSASAASRRPPSEPDTRPFKDKVWGALRGLFVRADR